MRIEQPPPANANVIATKLGALGVLGDTELLPAHRHATASWSCSPTARAGASTTSTVAQALRQGAGTSLVLVHVGKPGETVYDGTQPEQGYHDDPTGATTLASLADAAGGTSLSQGDIARASPPPGRRSAPGRRS